MKKNVALRKESVDRNICYLDNIEITQASLSARRAWIEIPIVPAELVTLVSLSARRAWIEMLSDTSEVEAATGRSPQGERG